ncbi:MAG: Rrf2 family transcriptional regulator [Acidobacteria bacterium]|nr:Rrf2 family transcriptional regulator [Acidobacteriota bacterium]
MILSKGSVHGIRAMIYLAGFPADQWLSTRDIARQLGIPLFYLGKIAQRLVRTGLLTASRGVQGGVRLGRPPTAITLMHLIMAIDGDDIFGQCVLGLAGCGHFRPCPVHDQWMEIREQLVEMFRRTTLADLVAKIRRDGLRLTDADETVAFIVAPDDPVGPSLP